MALYLGAKVYMNDTVLYQYLKRIGCFIFLIESDLVKNNHFAFTPLSQEEKEHNRKILLNQFSTDTVVSNLAKGINRICRDLQNI